VTLSGGAKTLTGTTVAMNGNLIGGGNDLTVAGNAVLGDAVADKVNNLGALTVSENATLNAGTVSASSVTVTKTGSLNTGVSVVATGDQTYNGVVNAAGGDTLKGSTLTFGGGLDAGSQGLNVILNVGGHLGVTGTPIIALNHNNTIANANTDHGLWAAGTQVFDGLSGLLWSGVGSFAADDTFRRLLGAVLPDVKKGNVKPTQAARGKGVAKPALVPVEGSFREQLTAQQ